MYSQSEIANKIFWHLRKNYKTLKEAADRYGCTSAYLSAMQLGKRNPSKEILEDMGLEKKTFYVEK